jgi:hypothetical protein
MESSDCPSLGLHFDDRRDRTPNVRAAFLLPLVRPLAHGRRRGNGVNSDDFVQAIGNVCDRFVSVYDTEERFMSFSGWGAKTCGCGFFLRPRANRVT